jgi:ABC-type glycerol-3-phosphate transport system substrate-binding protein
LDVFRLFIKEESMEKVHLTRRDVIEASKKTMTRRDFIKMAALTAGATLLAAGAPQAVYARPLPSQEPEPVKLDVWWSGDIADLDSPWEGPGGPEWFWGGLARAAFKPWLVKHPGVSLNITGHGWDAELRANQLNALAAGIIPDATYGESFVSEFARMGIYKPVSRTSAGLFPDGPMAEARFNGKYYGLPQSSGTNALMVNLDVLERVGLPIDHLPTTWDQLLEDARKVSQVNNVDPYWGNNAFFCYGPDTVTHSYGIPLRVLPWFGQNHAPLADEVGHPKANTPKAVDTWAWFNQLLATSTPQTIQQPYGEGGAAWLFHFGITAYKLGWSSDMWYEGNPGAGFGGDPTFINAVAVPLPLPHGGKPSNVVIGNQINSALKGGKHPDLAMALVEEVWTSEDAQEWLPQNAGIWIPALKSLLRQWRTYNKLDAFVTDSAKAMVRVTMRELLDDNVDSLPRWPNNTPGCWTDWNDTYQAIWGGNLTRNGIKTELNNLQTKLLSDIRSPQVW